MKTVIHFGAGALGRGLTIPMLKKSGCKVIVVEAYEPLVEALKENLSYRLYSVTASPENQHQVINIDGVLSLTKDINQVKALLRIVDTVTTSVIRENVIHVAKLIAECWNTPDADQKTILLCENIENAHDYFRGLLKECSTSTQQLDNLMKIKVPNTMVDRGCMKNPNDILEVITDEFYEISVDKNVVHDTGIQYIPAIENIDSIFARKRFLVNTYVDSISFLGSRYELTSLKQALTDPRIQEFIIPYMALVKRALTLEYGYSKDDIAYWENKYSQRFSKQLAQSTEKTTDASARPLENIARNMLRKLGYEERFVYPLIIMLKHNESIESGFPLICEIVKSEKEKQNLSVGEISQKLKDMWCLDEYGTYVYNEVTKRLDYNRN